MLHLARCAALVAPLHRDAAVYSPAAANLHTAASYAVGLPSASALASEEPAAGFAAEPIGIPSNSEAAAKTVAAACSGDLAVVVDVVVLFR